MLSKMKRIGWVVEDKYSLEDKGYHRPSTVRVSKSMAINDSGFDRAFYQSLRRRGLARCVPVFVEVTDAK